MAMKTKTNRINLVGGHQPKDTPTTPPPAVKPAHNLERYVEQMHDKRNSQIEESCRSFLMAHGWDGQDLEQAKRIGENYSICLGRDGQFLGIRRCDKYVPMTNADRIRSMTNEELAEFLQDWKGSEDALKWLKDPANILEESKK